MSDWEERSHKRYGGSGEQATARRERYAYFYLLRELWRLSPLPTICAILKGILPGMIPFVLVLVTGQLIDEAYSGASVAVMTRDALLAAGLVMAMDVLYGFLEKSVNQSLEYMFERQIGPLSRKSMEMDFECLEDAEVHRMREEVNGFFPRFGLYGMVLDAMLHFTEAVTMMVMAIVVVVSKFRAGAGAKVPVLSNPLLMFGFFAFILALNWMNTRQLYKRNAVMEELYAKKRRPREHRRKYFMELFSKAETQKDLRMGDQEALLSDEIWRMHEEDVRYQREYQRQDLLKNGTSDLISAVSTVLVYLFSALYGYYGIISIGGVVAFAASIRKVTDSLFDFSQNLGEFKEVSMIAVKYVDFMGLPQRKHEGTIPVEKRRDGRFQVEFIHVSFCYPGAKEPVLKDLNLSFEIGEKMAIVGRNGSGKSTFIKLLCRLYDVTEGVIKVNGIDIRKYDPAEYAALFGVVFQDFTMFDFGLGESLACDIDYDRELALDALTRAGLKERVEALPKGLLTSIGKGFDEDGLDFSGGEKQKLAIARAIYKDAPFVIMDEPTAALDPEAECQVFEGFDRMVGKKTALYISHRLASCRFCEDILVFDQGAVVERGSHEALLANGGLYHSLWEAQAVYYT